MVCCTFIDVAESTQKNMDGWVNFTGLRWPLLTEPEDSEGDSIFIYYNYLWSIPHWVSVEKLNGRKAITNNIFL